MKYRSASLTLALSGLASCLPLHAETTSDKAIAPTVLVNTDNFVQAETDMYFSDFVKEGGFGKFFHLREQVSIDKQTVIRMNRDTLYSAGVFDLDAGPVTVTLPKAKDGRYMAVQVIDRDEHTYEVIYTPGAHTYTREKVGTRYVGFMIRILVNAADPKDVAIVNALQDEIQFKQPGGPGRFEVPNWDPDTQKITREALLALGALLPDSNYMFGNKSEIDPVRHLIGAAAGWGGNPRHDAIYEFGTPEGNDGKKIFTMRIKDVPVQGFWSVSVYNQEGFFQANPYNAYTLNNLTAKKAADGSVNIQFGGCDGSIANCLPIMEGWNYAMRLYRPKKPILDGSWKAPKPEPVHKSL